MEPGRNRPGLLLAVAGQWGSVGACVAVREAIATLRKTPSRRVGESVLALRVCVWAPRPVALERRRLAKRASMRKGCKGSGVGDDIRVFTGRGLKVGCHLKVACFVFNQKPWYFPGHHALAVRSAFALPHHFVGCPFTVGRGSPHSRCVASPFTSLTTTI